MSEHPLWLSGAQFARGEPPLPNLPHGVLREDDRRVISVIVRVIRGGLMWWDAPSVCGPPKTLCNRIVCWSLWIGVEC
jgi:transposase